MSQETERAQAFIRHVLNNPMLLDCSPLQKEEQILVFLDQNMEQLYPTFCSDPYFPGASRQQIRALLTQELMKITGSALNSVLQRLIYEQIELTYLGLFGQQRVDHEGIRRELQRLTGKIVRKSEARMALNGPLTALMHRIPDRYVDRIFESRNYIRFELEKVQKLRIGKRNLKQLLATALLIRPSIFLYTAKGSAAHPGRGTVSIRFAEQVSERVMRELPSLHPEVVRSGVESNVGFAQHPELRASSRLVALFSRMARDYRPRVKVDRGAAAPERSWFNIARRNYRYFGFDPKMIDELYKIATERGW
jgi:hypothetical protein